MLVDIGIEGVHAPAGSFPEEDLKQLGAFGVTGANVGVSCGMGTIDAKIRPDCILDFECLRMTFPDLRKSAFGGIVKWRFQYQISCFGSIEIPNATRSFTGRNCRARRSVDDTLCLVLLFLANCVDDRDIPVRVVN